MKMLLDICYLIFLLSGLFACKKEESAALPPAEELLLFDTIPLSRPIVPMVVETSGIADSRTFEESLWLHEDSQSPTQLMLLGYDGKVKKKVFLKGTQNRDWEEMTFSGTDLFVADIGDNRLQYSTYTIYQFPEPGAGVDTVKEIRSIQFKYPDNAHDAEAFLIDPASGDIYIITKNDNPSRLYKLAAPYSYTSLNTAQLVGNLPYTGIVGSALSANGKELLLKTYFSIYYYELKNNESLSDKLLTEGRLLPHQLEPQGEAIAFTQAGTGFYTLSEKGFSNAVNLHFYPRK